MLSIIRMPNIKKTKNLRKKLKKKRTPIRKKKKDKKKEKTIRYNGLNGIEKSWYLFVLKNNN